MNRNKNGFAHILLILTIVGIILAVGTFGIMGYQKQNNTPQQKNQRAVNAFAAKYTNCPKTDAVFSYLPLAEENFDSWIPLGKVADGHVIPADHVYLSAKQQAGDGYNVPVVMPSDGRIVQVNNLPAQYVGDKNVTKSTTKDYNITIAHSCRYFSIFIHLHRLSDVIVNKVGNVSPGATKKVSIDMQAGDVIGYVGSAPFDWSLIDTQTTLSGFINPGNYVNQPQLLHIVDPISIYTGVLRNVLIAKDRKKAEPYGGRVDWDQPGKLIGNWFRVGTNGVQKGGNRYWDNQLAIVPDAIDNDLKIYSTGNWNGVARQFVMQGNPDIANITPADGVKKIQLLQVSNGPSGGSTDQPAGVVLLQVLDNEKLRVEQFLNATLEQVQGFTAAAKTYER